MTEVTRVPASDDAWDSGELGRNAQHVKVAAAVDETKLDDALGLHLISVRLQKSLIDGLKLVAQANGIGYQPLMRQVLKRFVDSELRRMVRERQFQSREERAPALERKPTTRGSGQRISPSRTRKAA